MKQRGELGGALVKFDAALPTPRRRQSRLGVQLQRIPDGKLEVASAADENDFVRPGCVAEWNKKHTNQSQAKLRIRPGDRIIAVNQSPDYISMLEEIDQAPRMILSIEREIKSKTSAECGRLEAEAQAYQKQKQADAKVAVAKMLANGKRALGEAEGIASKAFEAKRQHQADMARLQILEKLVQNDGIKVATSEENHMGLAEENQVVTQVAQQGLEALRAKLAEITATSLSKLESTKPGQQAMRASTTGK